MHDHLLRPDPKLLPPHGGGGRVGSFALRGVLMSWMALVSCIALADVYTEVNDKISSSQWTAAQTLIDRQLQKQPADPQIRLMQSQMQTAQGHRNPAGADAGVPRTARAL